MRHVAVMLVLLGATPAFAQTQTPVDNGSAGRPGNDVGTGSSLPMSNKASNILNGSGVGGGIAPRLPVPQVGQDASVKQYLESAKTALAAGKTGEAQEALERAESRLLDRSVVPSTAQDAIADPDVAQITTALHALAGGDRAQAMAAIESLIAKL